MKVIPEKSNLVETARSAGLFSIFLQGLELIGLTNSLRMQGPYTIFAPVDNAFGKLPKDKLEGLFEIDNRSNLRYVLTKHIIPNEELSGSDLKRRDRIQSMAGAEIRIEARVGLWVNEGQVLITDLQASNGIVHGIDTVLLSPADNGSDQLIV